MRSPLDRLVRPIHESARLALWPVVAAVDALARWVGAAEIEDTEGDD